MISVTNTPRRTATDPGAPAAARRGSRALGVTRIVVGLFLIAMAGLPKLGAQAAWAADFDRWGVPLADVSALAIGGFEVVGGALLVLGVLTRPLAASVTVQMLAALAFAGRVDGGQHLVLPLLVGAATALLVARGGGAWQARRSR